MTNPAVGWDPKLDAKLPSGYLDGVPSRTRSSRPSARTPSTGSYAGGTGLVPPGDIDAVVHSPSDALGALSEVEQDMRALEVQKIRLIGAAQKHGASWDEIGTALDVTRQAAWEKYRDRVRELLDATAARAQHSEDETLESAAGVLKEVRTRRRRA